MARRCVSPCKKGTCPSRYRRKLPVGIQTFREIGDHDNGYVDKTGFARQLIDEGSDYRLPFDRILIPRAPVERLHLVTHNRTVEPHGIDLKWK